LLKNIDRHIYGHIKTPGKPKITRLDTYYQGFDLAELKRR
jgi:hypothetical protein